MVTSTQVTAAAQRYDWALVAPWYRSVGQVRPHRETRPVIQKYADSDLTTAFLNNPQHSLVFDDDDVVFDVVPVAPPPRLPGLPGLKRTLTEREKPVAQADGTVRVELVDSNIRATTTRKLYLDLHNRFYLVTMEARLDTPDLRCVPADHMCDYGFVIRRIGIDGLSVDDGVGELARGYRQAKDDLQSLVLKGFGSSVPDVVAAQSQLAAAEAALSASLDRLGVAARVERWVPGEQALGAWESIEDETPDTIDEATFPLFPLVADGTDGAHAGVGHSLYFGLLQTGSAEVTVEGRSRFDDTSLYEVRTFARRHDPQCPRRRGSQDCQGQLFWSSPTERYQLADPFDPRGTGNRAVNVKIPDLDSLAAQIAALPPGRATPARIESPTLLMADANDGEMPSDGSENDEICFFAIPLITIVAMFVLQLFLGIILFIFNLWWMLKLKICLPPSVGFSADLDAAILAEAPFLSVEVDIDVALELGDIDSGTYADIQTRFKAALTGNGLSAAQADEIVATQSLQSIRNLAADLEVDPLEARAGTSVYETPVSEAEFEAWERTLRELVA